jgi:hypothetical protein
MKYDTRKAESANTWLKKAFETLCRTQCIYSDDYKKFVRQLRRFSAAAEALPCDVNYHATFFGKVSGTWVNREIEGDAEQLEFRLWNTATENRKSFAK